MIEVEPLLDALGKRNWRIIMLTLDEFPCHCLLQTWWHSGRSNLVFIWDCEEHLPWVYQIHHSTSQHITDTMAGCSCEIEQLTRSAQERTIAGIGLSKLIRSF